MLTQKPTTQFKRDVKLSQKRGCDISKLKAVMKKLVHEEPLDSKFRDHKLSGNYIGCRECHVQPDWLLIY
ncbi:MAG: type II toxin-antitoxin system YafQ family toxin [Chlamydiae bacterium]|nr:type II toxin-antitoxin system YafQ family toxin [Chlamydiota bacterium]